MEQDKNYVVDVAGPSSNLQPWKDQKTMLIWIGHNGQAPPGTERMIAFEMPEAETVAELNRWILEEMRKQERPDWDEYFMKIAQAASSKVGGVIVGDRRIVSVGWGWLAGFSWALVGALVGGVGSITKRIRLRIHL